jgi:hypothetical protein
MLIDIRCSFIKRFKFAIPSDMLEAINIGIDFLAVLISNTCSSERPVVPDIRGKLCSIQKLTHAIKPAGEEKSITADILFKFIAFA